MRAERFAFGASEKPANVIQQALSTFFCEFHWERIGMEEKEHIRVVQNINDSLRTPIKDWDACDWMMANLHGKTKKEMSRIRAKALTKTYLKRIFHSSLFNCQ